MPIYGFSPSPFVNLDVLAFKTYNGLADFLKMPSFQFLLFLLSVYGLCYENCYQVIILAITITLIFVWWNDIWVVTDCFLLNWHLSLVDQEDWTNSSYCLNQVNVQDSCRPRVLTHQQSWTLSYWSCPKKYVIDYQLGNKKTGVP